MKKRHEFRPSGDLLEDRLVLNAAGVAAAHAHLRVQHAPVHHATLTRHAVVARPHTSVAVHRAMRSAAIASLATTATAGTTTAGVASNATAAAVAARSARFPGAFSNRIFSLQGRIGTGPALGSSLAIPTAPSFTTTSAQNVNFSRFGIGSGVRLPSASNQTAFTNTLGTNARGFIRGLNNGLTGLNALNTTNGLAFNSGLNNGLAFNSGLNNGLGFNTGLNNGLGFNTGLNNGLGFNNGLNNGLTFNNGLNGLTFSGLGPTTNVFNSTGNRGIGAGSLNGLIFTNNQAGGNSAFSTPIGFGSSSGLTFTNGPGFSNVANPFSTANAFGTTSGMGFTNGQGFTSPYNSFSYAMGLGPNLGGSNNSTVAGFGLPFGYIPPGTSGVAQVSAF